jgi:hypothetical protein
VLSDAQPTVSPFSAALPVRVIGDAVVLVKVGEIKLVNAARETWLFDPQRQLRLRQANNDGAPSRGRK